MMGSSAWEKKRFSGATPWRTKSRGGNDPRRTDRRRQRQAQLAHGPRLRQVVEAHDRDLQTEGDACALRIAQRDQHVRTNGSQVSGEQLDPLARAEELAEEGPATVAPEYLGRQLQTLPHHIHLGAVSRDDRDGHPVRLQPGNHRLEEAHVLLVRDVEEDAHRSRARGSTVFQERLRCVEPRMAHVRYGRERCADRRAVVIVGHPPPRYLLECRNPSRSAGSGRKRH